MTRLRPYLLAGLAITVGFLIWRTFSVPKEAIVLTYEYPSSGEAVISMGDPYLDGIVKNGSKMRVFWGWYTTHPAARDELVFYRYSHHRAGVVRVIRAIPGDHFAVVKDTRGRGWNLKVNGKVISDLPTGNEKGMTPFTFGVSAVEPPLSHGEKERKGVLRPGEVIILSSRGPGIEDSSVFGILSLSDILGRVEPLP